MAESGTGMPDLGSGRGGIRCGGGGCISGGGLPGVWVPFMFELAELSGVLAVLGGDRAESGWWLWDDGKDAFSWALADDVSGRDDLKERRLLCGCLCDTFRDRLTGSPPGSGEGWEGRGGGGRGNCNGGGDLRSSGSSSSAVSWPFAVVEEGWDLQSRSQSSGVMSPDAALQAASWRCGCICRWAWVSLQKMFILYWLRHLSLQNCNCCSPSWKST